MQGERISVGENNANNNLYTGKFHSSVKPDSMISPCGVGLVQRLVLTLVI
jgi:hypothetical protein